MEGFINFKLKPWQRRVLTRGLAITPALIVTLIYNSEAAVSNLLVISQVILSLTLTFATAPLVYFTSDVRKMGKDFVNNKVLTVVASLVTLLIAGLNVYLLSTPTTWSFQS